MRLKTIIAKDGEEKRSFRYEKCPIDTDAGWSEFTFEDEEEVRRRWLYEQLIEFKDQHKLFIDIGAAAGSYTLPALAFGWNVLAFAPEADCLCLENNVKLNNGKFETGIEIVRGGVCGKDADYLLRTDSLERKVLADPIHVPTDYYTKDKLNERRYDLRDKWIPTIAFDKFWPLKEKLGFQTNGKPEYVKIDVEGMEVDVLKGMSIFLYENKPKYVMVENHEFKDAGIAREVIWTFNEVLGLDSIYKHKQPVQYHSISHTLFTNISE